MKCIKVYLKRKPKKGNEEWRMSDSEIYNKKLFYKVLRGEKEKWASSKGGRLWIKIEK